MALLAGTPRLAAGVADAAQKPDALPQDPADAPLDPIIVTEQGATEIP